MSKATTDLFTEVRENGTFDLKFTGTRKQVDDYINETIGKLIMLGGNETVLMPDERVVIAESLRKVASHFEKRNMAEEAVTQWDDLLDLAHMGKTFEVGGCKYIFKDFKFRAKKNHVVATRVSDGATHRFEAVQVARAFGLQNSAVPRVRALDSSSLTTRLSQ